MLAVGEHLWGAPDESLLRASTALRGGLGGTHEEVCGVISGGALIIGALYGRTSTDVDANPCKRLAGVYWTRFRDTFGLTRCGDLLASGYGSKPGMTPCAVLAERATPLLLEVLAEAEEEMKGGE